MADSFILGTFPRTHSGTCQIPGPLTATLLLSFPLQRIIKTQLRDWHQSALFLLKEIGCTLEYFSWLEHNSVTTYLRSARPEWKWRHLPNITLYRHLTWGCPQIQKTQISTYNWLLQDSLGSPYISKSLSILKNIIRKTWINGAGDVVQW